MTIVGYLFGLPQQFFASASALGETTQEASASQASQQLPVTTTPSSPARPAWRESGAVCLTCGIGVGCPGFSSPTEQREHFKTDWHRYNVKRRLVKQPAISEEQFERILEQDTEVSISGSESGSSEDDGLDVEDGEGGRGDGLGMADAGHGRKGTQAAASTIPRVTFQAADGSLFTVWRCLLRQDHVKAPQGQPSSPGELLGELRRLRAACGSWMVVLLRGGHFAATVFKAREARPLNSAKHDTDGLDCFDVTAHKTFHRYVVRAKAGGKQSTKDATGKYARSAGSRLRRYNEAALVRDIQELLASWANHVESADLIFVHAPASNARSLFSEGQTTLLPSNPRLRRVPFVTHRPTFSETKRVLRLLCAVFRPDAVEQLLQAQRSAHAEKEAEAAAAAAAGALEAAKLGSTAAVDNTGPSTSGTSTGPHKEEQPQHGAAEAAAASTGTAAAGGNIATEGPLHKAAKAGDAPRVQRLLDSGHDPSIRDAKGRTPYALAADKDTRDVFRRFMAQNMDRWNYAAAGIPSPLTEEMEAAQQAKKAAHKAKLKAKDAERKAAKAAAGGGAGSTGRTESAEERKQALEDEIAKAAAEAEAIAARLTASAKAATSSSVRAAASSSGSGKLSDADNGHSGGINDWRKCNSAKYST
ncbi:hypothetical protein VOLCADRAFT_106637 [Volvox carteri f. nagariensis]|uniref:VLRF1 domain-containing protein n=1 Tax=Volvox carteri f. nagariensis TaxID=3068 RepID=D8U8T5_VOLCA|nr:uncharacterized protein VOLCADRAFT_106637 [Volvox carteri f. nagariensis]EFJ43803.1 hypothetical protein VOLCADRAFT_106637 [Volvox carteri f. nagariensis]|eukprot:XP_002955049.1 hypothetical protein VOLCADRAFT_106637 [Volvox carteri f. nagariensis]